MNELQIFNSAQFGQMRTTRGADGDPLFCLADVCKALGISNRTDVASRLDSCGVDSIYTSKEVISHGKGTGVMKEEAMLFINEQNLYRCIFQSRKPQAKQFQDWVFAEVLPSIRQNGGYIAAKVDESPEAIMARALQVADATLKRQKQQIASLEAENEVKQQRIDLQTAEIKKAAPKVEYYDQCLQSTASFTTTQVAKELGLTANSLNRILQDHHIIYKQSGQFLLYTAYIKWGLHAVRTYAFVANSGEVITSHRTVWTERGRRFIIALAHNGYNVKAAIAAINGADAK